VADTEVNTETYRQTYTDRDRHIYKDSVTYRKPERDTEKQIDTYRKYNQTGGGIHT